MQAEVALSSVSFKLHTEGPRLECLHVSAPATIVGLRVGPKVT